MNASDSDTIQNVESIFSGVSMAQIRFLHSARVTEDTAAPGVQHALGHLDLLIPAEQTDPAKYLKLAIDGESYAYTKRYPNFRRMAFDEVRHDIVKEIDEQIRESRVHAERFQATQEKAAKHLDALTRVEEGHANHYRETLKRTAS